MDENDFRAFIDAAQPSIDGTEISDLATLYASLNLPISNSLSTRQVCEVLRERAVEALPVVEDPERPSNECVTSWLLSQWRNHFLLRHWCDGEPLQPYYDVLDQMRSLPDKGMRLLPLEEAPDQWSTVIAHVRDLKKVSRALTQGLENTLQKEWEASKACGYLRRRGYSLNVCLGRLDIADDVSKRLLRDLRKRVTRIGPETVIGTVFNAVRGSLDEDFDRYMLGRRPVQFGTATVQTPWNLILHLAVAELGRVTVYTRAVGEEIQTEWRRLLRDSSALTACLTLQPFTIWDGMFVNTENIASFLQDTARYDLFFTLRQMKRAHALESLKVLIEYIEREEPSALGYPGGAVVDFAQAVLMGRGVGPQRVDEHSLSPSCDPNTVPFLAQLLNDFAHPCGAVNAEFIDLESLERIDAEERPLFRLRNGQCLVLDTRMAAFGFVTRLIELCGERLHHKTRRNLGLAIEEILTRRFETLELDWGSGKFRQGTDQEGEIDAVWQQPDNIYFFEMKQMGLDILGRAGRLDRILFPLSKVLLKGQQQLAHAHHVLAQNHRLDLNTNTDTYSVTMKGRRVVRIAVTFGEYQGMQGRSVTQRVLHSLSKASYQTDDPDLQERFNKVSRITTKMNETIAALQRVDENVNENPWYDCWFVPLTFLLQLLDDATSASDFEERLRSVNAVVMGSRDFFHVYREMERIKRETAQSH